MEQTKIEVNAETISDRVFRYVCALDGLFSESSQGRCLKLIFFAMWASATMLWFCWLLSSLQRDRTQRLIVMRVVLTGSPIIDMTACTCLKLWFIMKRADFEYILRIRGRRSSDLAPILMCALALQMLNLNLNLNASCGTVSHERGSPNSFERVHIFFPGPRDDEFLPSLQ